MQYAEVDCTKCRIFLPILRLSFRVVHNTCIIVVMREGNFKKLDTVGLLSGLAEPVVVQPSS